MQKIDPQLYHCGFGFYMTAVYQNIENDKNEVRLNCYSTGPDISVIYVFNKKKSRYEVVDDK